MVKRTHWVPKKLQIHGRTRTGGEKRKKGGMCEKMNMPCPLLL